MHLHLHYSFKEGSKMNEKKREVCENIMGGTKKGELEEQKVYYWMRKLEEILQEEQKEDPAVETDRQLEGLLKLSRDFQGELHVLEEMTDRIYGFMLRLVEERSTAQHENGQPYLYDTYYYRAVAEQEQDLYRMNSHHSL